MPAPGPRPRSTPRQRSSGRLDANIAEAAWSRAVADMHRLRRLTLAAVDHAEHLPLGRTRHRVARPPEHRRLPAVDRVAHQPGALAVRDLPPVLGAELKIEAPVVDAPRAVGLEVDAGHADDRQPRPPVGAHRAIADLTDRGGGLARREIPAEDALVDEHG